MEMYMNDYNGLGNCNHSPARYIQLEKTKQRNKKIKFDKEKADITTIKTNLLYYLASPYSSPDKSLEKKRKLKINEVVFLKRYN